jgi:hypothetical protein
VLCWYATKEAKDRILYLLKEVEDMPWELTGNAGTNPPNDFLGTTDAQPLVISTNGAERVRVDDNGNVGIGTTTPDTKLTVQADDGSGAADSRAAQLRLRSAANPNSKLEIGYDNVGNFARIAALTENVAWRNIVLANNGGNVGIGTTTALPDTKLEVQGSDVDRGVFVSARYIGVEALADGVGVRAGDPECNAARGVRAFGEIAGVYARSGDAAAPDRLSPGWGVIGKVFGTRIQGQFGLWASGVRGSGPRLGVVGIGETFPPPESEDGLVYAGVYGEGPLAGVYGKGMYAVVGEASLPGQGAAGSFNGNVYVNGRFVVYGGPKSAAVPHPDGTHRLLCAVESPESWFEDFGRAELRDGRAEVTVDPDFAALVETDDYHVFLTAEGESNGLYISARTTSTFDVREQAEGGSTLNFSYRIVARRKDVSRERLAVVELPPRWSAPPYELPDDEAEPEPDLKRPEQEQDRESPNEESS